MPKFIISRNICSKPRRNKFPLKSFYLALILYLFGIVNPLQATLFDRGNGLIYSDTLNITFLSDVNYAYSSGFDSDGIMTWQTAMDWAAQLEYGGFSDWRLPTAYKFNGDLVSSYYEPETELGYLRHVELSVAYEEGIHMCSDPDLDLFNFLTNGNDQLTFWTSTIVEDYPYHRHFVYDFSSFGEYWDMQFPPDREFYAWAVRDGDVTTVPEPSTIYLIALSFFGLFFVRKLSLL